MSSDSSRRERKWFFLVPHGLALGFRETMEKADKSYSSLGCSRLRNINSCLTMMPFPLYSMFPGALQLLFCSALCSFCAVHPWARFPRPNQERLHLVKLLVVESSVLQLAKGVGVRVRV